MGTRYKTILLANFRIIKQRWITHPVSKSYDEFVNILKKPAFHSRKKYTDTYKKSPLFSSFTLDFQDKKKIRFRKQRRVIENVTL